MNEQTQGGSMGQRVSLVKLGIVFAIAAGFSISMTHNAMAADATSAYDPTDAYIRGTMTKLGRGIANIGTSPLEIIRMASITTNQEGFLAGSTAGLGKGLWRGVLRAVVGLYETVTFFVEIPEDFKPLIQPEYVFDNLTWTAE